MGKKAVFNQLSKFVIIISIIPYYKQINTRYLSVEDELCFVAVGPTEGDDRC